MKFIYFFLINFNSSLVLAYNFKECKNNLGLNFDNILSNAALIDKTFKKKLTSKFKDEFVDIRVDGYHDLYRFCVREKYSVKDLSIMDRKKLYQTYFILKRVFFFTREPGVLSDISLVVSEMLRRENNDKRPIKWTFKAYLSIRDFENAKKLKSKYNYLPLPLVPKIMSIEKLKEDDNSRILYKLVKTKNVLLRESFKFQKEGQIIVIGSPYCNPSRKFVSWLKKKPEIESIFSENAVWLMPQDGHLKLESIRKVNENNKNIAYHYVHNESHWPEIDYWGTPSFYFYKNGNLIDKIIGYSDNGDFEKNMNSLLLKINLTD